MDNLPTLGSMDEKTLSGWFEGGGLFFVLLFRREEKHFATALQQNWTEFDEALGERLHVITFLDGKQTYTKDERLPRGYAKKVTGLKFPENYERSVAWAINELGINPEQLPALFCVNGQDAASKANRGPAYWPLGASTSGAAAELRHIIGKLKELGHETKAQNPEQWRDAVATKFGCAASSNDTIRYLRRQPEELKAVLKGLLRMLSQYIKIAL